jgi:hypothetical protein
VSEVVAVGVIGRIVLVEEGWTLVCVPDGDGTPAEQAARVIAKSKNRKQFLPFSNPFRPHTKREMRVEKAPRTISFLQFIKTILPHLDRTPQRTMIPHFYGVKICSVQIE